MNAVYFNQERWGSFWPDCQELTNEHHEEVDEISENMPFDIDAESYAAIDAAGALQLVTARKNGKLIGYCFFTIGNSLNSKGVVVGTQGPYFVSKSERSSGAGLGLYRESIRLMKERGVKNIYPHHYLRGDSAALKPFFERLGAVEMQHEYSLWIGE